VIRTRVGYTGGTTQDPTYRDLGDHSEAIQIDYDPTQITYQELLDVFWYSHNPTARAWSRQYASFIFYHSDEQKEIAIEAKERQAAKRGKEIVTEIVPASEFYLAEAYHQKYQLRRDGDLLAEFIAIYPDVADFVASTAAARVNGYLGGHGSLDALEDELGDLGLSPAASERLLKIARRRIVSQSTSGEVNGTGDLSSGETCMDASCVLY
jgi:peptide-methionine (S)-S-oxide reductase